MRAAVRAAFFAFTTPLEGVVKWLYLDEESFVTIAIGNLVDPIGAALALPLRRADGSLASPPEIVADWQAVKNDPNAAHYGWRWCEHLTKLRLDDDGIAAVVMAKLTLFDNEMRTRFPGWEGLSADAQLGVLSLTWACGGAFRFPQFEAAIDRRDFTGAANACHMNETGNAGLRPRNIANKILFLNAAYVAGSSLDPGVLYWPTSLVDEEPTQPAIPNPPSEPTQIVHPDVAFGEVDLDPDKADE